MSEIKRPRETEERKHSPPGDSIDLDAYSQVAEEHPLSGRPLSAFVSSKRAHPGFGGDAG